ncbi:MAG: hypothetical protein R2843_06025 [Thermomicrobiales bacterium]
MCRAKPAGSGSATRLPKSPGKPDRRTRNPAAPDQRRFPFRHGSGIDELVGLIEQDGDGVQALREARTTLELLLAVLVSADQGGARIELSGKTS